MTTTSGNRNFARIATSVVALALGLMVCANASAQNAAAPNAAPQKAVPSTEDMRLWSFGDCERRFPYNATPEHKECVRVVGSPEAVEARALRVCDVSHPSDKEEAERCKANYKANKIKAAADGVVANAPAAPQDPPSEEVMRRVKAIGSAAVEEQRATKAPTPKVDDDHYVAPHEASTWKRTPMTVVLLAIAVGVGVNLFRRRQAQSV
jgi:hypothetical protein